MLDTMDRHVSLVDPQHAIRVEVQHTMGTVPVMMGGPPVDCLQTQPLRHGVKLDRNSVQEMESHSMISHQEM